ncbi:MAG: cyclic pyranopterin monophosphate synthase MoaC [Candidatus Bipolaricaulaceae bacterium]
MKLVRMVDISGKPVTERVAVAKGEVHLSPSTCQLIMKGALEKGDALSAGQIAGILAAKRAWELIPLCHPISLTDVNVQFHVRAEEGVIEIEATAKCQGKTGAEMEALTAVAVAALTIYDMVKAVEPGARITNIRLVRKKGGKSGEVELET